MFGAALGWEMKTKKFHITNRYNNLKNGLQTAWVGIQSDVIENLVLCMLRRL